MVVAKAHRRNESVAKFGRKIEISIQVTFFSNYITNYYYYYFILTLVSERVNFFLPSNAFNYNNYLIIITQLFTNRLFRIYNLDAFSNYGIPAPSYYCQGIKAHGSYFRCSTTATLWLTI